MEPTIAVRWRASEYVFYKKTADWYWYFGVATIALIAFAVYVKNPLFAFVVGIGAFTMVLYANKIPETLDYAATEEGIGIGEKFYNYQSFEAFWIFKPKKENKEPVLLLSPSKKTEPMYVIPLGDAKLDELRTFLLNFLDEREMRRTPGQVFMELIGF